EECMRRWGPLFLVLVAALLGSAAWYVLRSGAPASVADASNRNGGAAASAAEGAASADAPAGPDRVALSAEPPLPPVGPGPDATRGRAAYAADRRRAGGAGVRAFRSTPPLRSRKVAQEMRRGSADRKPAADQDLSDFEIGDGRGGARGGIGSRSGARVG